LSTRGLVPRAANEGFVGTIGKPWGDGRVREFQALRYMGRYVAAVSLSGQKVVVLGATGLVYANSGNPAHVGAILGVTNGATLAGQEVDVVEKGAVDEPAWSWSQYQPIWLSGIGLISGTPPASGFSCQIGFALTPTRIFISVQAPVVLA
jgi:hypothetical protein